MATAMARLEKRSVEVKAPVETSEPERLPLPPPSTGALFHHVPMAPLEVGQYGMPTPGVPMGVSLPKHYGCSVQIVYHWWEFRCPHKSSGFHKIIFICIETKVHN